MKALKKLMLIAVAIQSVVACGKKGGGGGAAPTPQESYYLSSGTCYQKSNNAQVDHAKCDSVSYYIKNNRCYDSTTKKSTTMENCMNLVNQYYYLNNTCCDKDNNNQYVSDNYCQGEVDDNGDNGYNNNGGTCRGWYYRIIGGYIEYYNCSVQDCRRATFPLTSYETNQTVRCQ